MGAIDRKRFFIDQLQAHYRDIISDAHLAESRAASAAEEIQREARRRDDAKGAIELGRMVTGHRRRRQRARQELESLIRFAGSGLREFAPNARVELGAMVDVSVEGEVGSEERTLLLLPVGAGTELNGPGGDGFVSVITPGSPLGKALHGAQAGDVLEVATQRDEREWTVVDLC
jgi:transcription elongation GreA/GreB family factor